MEGTVKEFFRKEFDICYETVKRYENFSILIKAYPGLLICGLSLTQLIKHRTHILDYLDKDPELSEKLSFDVIIVAQGIEVSIKQLNVDSIPISKQKAAYDPDQEYETDDTEPAVEENIRDVVDSVEQEQEEARMEHLSEDTTKLMTI
jgi:hypothetical protein